MGIVLNLLDVDLEGMEMMDNVIMDLFQIWNNVLVYEDIRNYLLFSQLKDVENLFGIGEYEI